MGRVELTIRLDGWKELIANVLSGRWYPMLHPWPGTVAGTRTDTFGDSEATFTDDFLIENC